MGLFSTCERCKKRCFSSALNDKGLCRECQDEVFRSELQRTEAYISQLAEKIGNALSSSVIVPNMGYAKIESIYNDCLFLKEHLPEWKQYPLFSAAFEKGLEPYKGITGMYSHKLFPHGAIDKKNPPDFDEEFKKMRARASDIETKCIITKNKAYDYAALFTVVGVTFRNDDGKERQKVIKRMGKGYKDNDSDKVYLKEYTFEGHPAIAVFFGKDQIGNISKSDLPYFEKNWVNYHRVGAYEVSGFDILGVMLRVCFRGKEIR